MTAPRLHLTEGMRRFLDYPKFVDATRMLILDTGYFFDKSWRRAAEELGWEVATVPSVIAGSLTRDDVAALFRTLAEFKPDFVLTSNYAGMDAAGLFARFFNDAKMPYVSWFTDTPRMILFNRTMYVSEYAVAATWEKAYAPHLEAYGFSHVHYMPLATDPTIFNGSPPNDFDRDLAFVGNSMLVQLGEALEAHRDLPQVVAAVEAALNEGRVTKVAYTEGVSGIIGEALYDSLNESQRRNAELLINYEATSQQRVNLVNYLIPMGIEARGDGSWQRILSDYESNLGYFDDLAPFYRSTAINLNNTSLQMRDAVNQRVFDCPAAGGFLITDNQPDLHDLFDVENEVVTYESLPELGDKIQYYLKRPEERAAIVGRARAHVLAEHTHRHRLQSLEAYLKPRFGVKGLHVV
ncbi:MAG: glycosyltransferase [Candidatus Hydrogenedentes bacterium]|nr:glycosyltransferase [Candidatus Hydrogenedentota bacterium]